MTSEQALPQPPAQGQGWSSLSSQCLAQGLGLILVTSNSLCDLGQVPSLSGPQSVSSHRRPAGVAQNRGSTNVCSVHPFLCSNPNAVLNSRGPSFPLCPMRRQWGPQQEAKGLQRGKFMPGWARVGPWECQWTPG